MAGAGGGRPDIVDGFAFKRDGQILALVNQINQAFMRGIASGEDGAGQRDHVARAKAARRAFIKRQIQMDCIHARLPPYSVTDAWRAA